MESLKKKKDALLVLFVISFVVLNVLFFARNALIDWWYDQTNAYDHCSVESLEDSELYTFQTCDVNNFSKFDDVVNGVFALSALISVVGGSTLIIRTIERSWKKKKRR